MKSDQSILFSVQHIHSVFNGNVIHQDVSLDIPEGDIVVLLGQSGCGKSVLLKIMLRLLQPVSGQIIFEGQDLLTTSERELNALRKRMGVVFQASALFDSLTVYENIVFVEQYYRSMSNKEMKMKAEQLCEWVGLDMNVLEIYPSQLSGGMQKRVAIARALMVDPKIILFDEPTTGLDPIMTEVINILMNRLKNEKNITALVVTHDMKSAFQISDYIYLMHKGNIEDKGTAEQIQNSHNPYTQNFIGGMLDESFFS